jgi:hypothetical protein
VAKRHPTKPTTDEQLAAHGLTVGALVGFATGIPCVCQFLANDVKPCISCRARAVHAETLSVATELAQRYPISEYTLVKSLKGAK